mmetsp:Transcript_30/g.68  ORF Transcript_30/g.68 Transcript_30/m.68 type:complete len:240 (-) Transcript_30:489-1208(-)
MTWSDPYSITSIVIAITRIRPRKNALRFVMRSGVSTKKGRAVVTAPPIACKPLEGLDKAPHRGGHIGHTHRKRPFVVVPGQNAHQAFADHLCLVGGKDGRKFGVVEVDRHFLLGVIGQNPTDGAPRGLGHSGVDLFDGDVAAGLERQVHGGHVRCGHAHRGPVQLACKFRQHFAQGLGCPGRGWDHRHGRRARAVQIIVATVEGRLIAGIAVDRGHDAMFNAHGFAQHFGQGREAVGGA